MNSHQQPAMQVVVSVVLQGGYHLSMPRAWQDRESCRNAPRGWQMNVGDCTRLDRLGKTAPRVQIIISSHETGTCPSHPALLADWFPGPDNAVKLQQSAARKRPLPICTSLR